MNGCVGRFFRGVMTKYGVAVAIVAMALSGGARVGAQAQPPQERINAALARAQQVGIPVALLESKIAEGKAKGVSLERIAAAIERRQTTLERASQAHAHLLEQLAYQAGHDPLTRLANRRAGDAFLADAQHFPDVITNQAAKALARRDEQAGCDEQPRFHRRNDRA